MKKRISILVFVPIVVFVAFAALLWALLHHTLIQDRDDMFRVRSVRRHRGWRLDWRKKRRSIWLSAPARSKMT